MWNGWKVYSSLEGIPSKKFGFQPGNQAVRHQMKSARWRNTRDLLPTAGLNHLLGHWTPCWPVSFSNLSLNKLLCSLMMTVCSSWGTVSVTLTYSFTMVSSQRNHNSLCCTTCSQVTSPHLCVADRCGALTWPPSGTPRCCCWMSIEAT